MNFKTLSRGFTLIELLVVIAIIGILSAIVFANFSDARNNAKNNTMRTELRETQLAIEVYKAQYSRYPAALSDLIPDFISETPDPAKSANGSCAIDYTTNAGGGYYKLTAVRCIEDTTVSPTDEFARCPNYCSSCPATVGQAGFDESLAVYSAGGECL